MSAKQDIIGRLEKTGFEFLMSDLAVAMTMTHIAADASADSEKRIRNQENARRAYDTILRIASKAVLTDDEQGELEAKLGQLQSALEKLGEVF